MNTNVTSKRGHHFIAGLLDADSVVIDLGANRGYFSTEIIEECNCYSYAIEAVPHLLQSIPEHPKIRKFNLVICDSDGPVTFNVSSQEESGSMTELPQHMLSEVIEVQGITLKSFLDWQKIQEVDLLKMDIEGAEIGLLKSIDDETLGKIKQIAIEFHDFLPYFDQADDIILIKEKLKRIGFECIKYSMKCHADVLFVNVSKSGLKPHQILFLKWVDRFIRAGKRLLQR